MGALAIVEVVVLLALGVVALVLGGALAVRASQRRLDLLRLVSWALAFGSLSGVFSGLAQTAVNLARRPMTPELAQLGWAGVAEALVPGIFGFGVLTVAWALAAVGVRRQD
ncbi:MAG TPA: hypothetical protein VMX54_16615 [Vicinamibacteria bacterium]|nr:hypothetical protein [Vicinamibacteria bacterium]